jgi:hypothetical protein
MTQLSANLLSYQQLLTKVSRLINVVNSKGIFSKEEIANEYAAMLTEVQQQIGAPLTQYDPFIKGEPPISSKMNLFFDGCSADVSATAGQIDLLNAKSISAFNLFSKEIENEKRFSERIASKAKVLQMYSKSPSDDIFYVGDSFDNDDLIDYSKMQAGFNPLIKNGIMSLSVSATQKWNANVVKILSSGGFIGNSHQVIKSVDSEGTSNYKYRFEDSSTLNNTMSIKDSNPLTYFEYEALSVDKTKPTPTPSIPARDNEFKYIKSEFNSANTGESDLVDWSNRNTDDPLVLVLELASVNSSIANSIDITPYFGSMKYVEVDSIVIFGKDGVSEELLKTPIYIGSSLVPLNLQMAKSYFYNKATIRFSERQLFKVQISFKQSEYLNIDIQHLYWKPTSSNRDNPFVNLERFNPDALNKDIYEKVEYNKYNLLPTITNPTEYSKLGTAFKTINVSVKKKPVARKFYVIELGITSPLNVQQKAYFERWDSSFEVGTGNLIKTPFFTSEITFNEDEIKNKNYNTIDAAQQDFDDLLDIYLLDQANPTLLDDGSTVNTITVVEQSFTAQEKLKRYNIAVQTDKERYPAKRWCIGLRDVEVYKETFNSQLEIVSLPFNFDFPVESVMLNIDSNIDDTMLKNVSILGYISADNGSSWIQISPIQLDFSGVPEVLFFNQSVLNEYRLSGGSYLSYPLVPKEVKNILVKIKIVKKNRLNFTPSIYSYQLIAKVKKS